MQNSIDFESEENVLELVSKNNDHYENCLELTAFTEWCYSDQFLERFIWGFSMLN